MKKWIWIPLTLVILALLGGMAWLYKNLDEQKQANQEMQELAELDKQEMANEYQQFAEQYGEMKTRINNDSLIEQLTKEQLKTQQLLEELKQVKANDAREITRLKKELATMREVLRSYVIEIDSLNRLNQNLAAENNRMKEAAEETAKQIEDLNADNAKLNDKVSIAAQLDATAITMTPKDKRGKQTDRMMRCKDIQVNFNIAKNVTAANGLRTFYVRITTPNGTVLNGGGSFTYENRSLQYSMKRQVEYGGNETPVTMYWNVNETLSGGTYQVSVFAEGHMIGSKTFTFK